MFDAERPVYAPILQPSDQEALTECAPLQAAVLSATCAVNERLGALHRRARERADLLIIDPRTAAFQFEGYMSTEEVRSLPYSPGRTTLGTLWDSDQFGRERRAALIDSVLGLQRHLEADVAMAPYFFLPAADTQWLDVAVDIARESREHARGRPLAAHLCVDIDVMMGDRTRSGYVQAFADTGADLLMLTVVNLDEREANPREMSAVLDLVQGLAGHAPTLLLYAGRAGLSAIGAGAAGYAGGSLELEAHPRRYLREGMVNLHSNTHYLANAMLRLPVRLAAAVQEALPGGDASDCPRATRMVHRERSRRAIDAKSAEAAWLADHAIVERRPALAARFEDARGLGQEAQRILLDGNAPETLDNDAFHYLEVLRETAGGDAASLPVDAGL